MADQDDRRLEQTARALYRRRAAALEPEVRKRLAKARREALARAERPAGRGLRLPVLVPAGAAAAVAAAAVILLIRQPGTDTDYAPLAGTSEPAEDMEILLGSEELELLDDLDFYLWLEDEPEIG